LTTLTGLQTAYPHIRQARLLITLHSRHRMAQTTRFTITVKATYNGAGTNDNDTLIMMDYHSTANAANNNIDLHPGYNEAAGVHPANYTTPTIQNVETIDLSIAGGDHTISNITAQDVLNMTANNSSHVLTINGDSGDHVNIADLFQSDGLTNDTTDGSWSATTSTFSSGGHNYTVYNGTAADGTTPVSIRIEDAIAKQLISAK
jgi:hypothetical protein